MTPQADQPLSTRVRLGTRADHQAAQGSGFLDALATGRLPLAAYADLAAQHYAIYETLEKAAATMGADPIAGVFVAPELTRLPALADDLRFLLESTTGVAATGCSATGGSAVGAAGGSGTGVSTVGATGGSAVGATGGSGTGGSVAGGSATVRPATEAYCARLTEVAFDRSAAFVAHHYTRYLGDLSGGQYLGPAIARAYGLAGEGHQFFIFTGVEPVAFRARYRELLDRAAWTAGEQDEFLAEVALAYRLNIAVLAELKEEWA